MNHLFRHTATLHFDTCIESGNHSHYQDIGQVFPLQNSWCLLWWNPFSSPGLGKHPLLIDFKLNSVTFREYALYDFNYFNLLRTFHGPKHDQSWWLCPWEEVESAIVPGSVESHSLAVVLRSSTALLTSCRLVPLIIVRSFVFSNWNCVFSYVLI